MTTKDSILALAAKISTGTVPNVATDAQALGELAKAMCGSAPTEPIATVDDAIAFITANYSGGGGGVDVGPLVRVQHSDNAPVVGTSYVYGDACYSVGSIAVGDATIFDVTGNEVSIDHVAAGATVSTLPYVASETAAFYVVAYDPDNDNVITSVESVTVEHEFLGTAPSITLAYVVPAVETGKALWVVFPYGT